jgi:hypothetical protein
VGRKSSNAACVVFACITLLLCAWFKAVAENVLRIMVLFLSFRLFVSLAASPCEKLHGVSIQSGLESYLMYVTHNPLEREIAYIRHTPGRKGKKVK